MSKTLTDFGYGFNSEGKLRQLIQKTGEVGDEPFEFNISSDQMKNQAHYEELGEAITEYVYKLLEENGMHKIYVPDNVPEDEATFIFTSKKELLNSGKLLILIHGSGVVRAGQWSRSLIINHSLDHGTQIPYIKKAIELGYDILIMNTNDNYRTMLEKRKMIEFNESPTNHATYVWNKYVIGSNPKSVAIVAHSYGGVVTVSLAQKYTEFFKDKVFAVGFTDSVHSLSGNNNVRSILKEITRNWVTSSKPLNEKLSDNENDISRYSAGHTKHEWTSYSCISALFEFLEDKYSKFLEEKSSKKSKLDL